MHSWHSLILAILNDIMPSILIDLLHLFFLRHMFLVLPKCFQTMKDLWSWTVAILPESATYIIAHLLRAFECSCSRSWGPWRLAPCPTICWAPTAAAQPLSQHRPRQLESSAFAAGHAMSSAPDLACRPVIKKGNGRM